MTSARRAAGRVHRLLRGRVAWSTLGLFVTAALFRSAQNSAQTTFPLLAREHLGAGAGVVGALGTASGVVMVAASVGLAVRVPTRAAASAVATGAAVLAAALLTVGSSTSMAQLAVGVVLLGAAGGITPPSLVTAIGATAGEHREKQLARYATVLSASLAAGPLVETAILYLAGQKVRVPFFVFAAFPVMALALGLRRRGAPTPDPETGPVGRRIGLALDMEDATAAAAAAAREGPDRPAGRDDQAREDGEDRGTPRDKTAAVPARRHGRAVLLGTPGGRVALIMQLLYTVPFGIVVVFGALIAKGEFGLNAAHSQLGFTTFFATSLASRVVVARRSPVRAKLAVFAVCIVVTLAGMALLAAGGPAGTFYVAMALLGVPHGAIFPLALSLVASSSRHEQLAAANAGWFAAVNVVAAVTPILLGAVAAAAGFRVMTLAALAPVALFSLLLIGERRAAAAL